MTEIDGDKQKGGEKLVKSDLPDRLRQMVRRSEDHYPEDHFYCPSDILAAADYIEGLERYIAEIECLIERWQGGVALSPSPR